MPTAKPARKKALSANKKAAKTDLAPVFSALRRILEELGNEVTVQADKPGNFHTEIPSIVHRGRPLYFAGVRTGKNYVGYYLMSVYYNAALLKGVSPALKKRMQGKACFNFSAVDEECFSELRRLTANGLKIFKTEKFRQDIQRMQ